MRGHCRLALVVLLVWLVACAPASSPTPSATLTPTVVPTPTPLPQAKVSVGDYELFYRCAGEGWPTVIVEDGFLNAGASGGSWTRVADEVAKTTRICLYDRATLGQSQAEIEVRTAQDVADDLHKLLQNGHIGGPYVLVPHSLGGFFSLVYADRYRQEVVGMVLVDATPPTFEKRRVESGLPPDLTFSSTSGGFGEKLNIAGSAEQAAQVTSLGDLPLVVLCAQPPEPLWPELQKEQSELSTNGRMVMAYYSTHRIHQTEPQIVIDAILQVAAEARVRAGLPTVSPATQPTVVSPTLPPLPAAKVGDLADRGRTVYFAACRDCHSSESQICPKVDAWTVAFSTAKELYDYASMRMPPDRPGVLKPEHYFQIVAWVLEENQVVQPDTLVDILKLDQVLLTK